MNPRHFLILSALSMVGCDGASPTTPSPATQDPVSAPPGPSVIRPAFKVMTYNVQLSNFGAPNVEARKPMIVDIIRSEAADIVGLQELGSTHRPDLQASLEDLCGRAR